MTSMPMVMSDEEVERFGRWPDAGFGALETARGLLPLVAMTVEARVAGVVATIEVAQTFVNTIGAAIEATYIFPLPDRAAVHRFQMEVAGRVIDGVIDERGQARAAYDQAIAAGHRAAITEEERPGVFTLRVGNLMPGERATVRLALVGPLAVDDGEVTFRFPLVVAPRYIPGAKLGGDQAGLGVQVDTDAVPDASRISPPVLLPGCPNPVRLALRVALDDGVVRDVASSLHAVTSALRDAQVIEVRPGERLDRDFILRWRIDGAALQSSVVCADDGAGGGTFALTVVPPSTTAVAARPRDVVFVIDRSGSMGGWKMVAARRAAARMIDTLTSRDRFCTIAFDDRVEMLPDRGLADATDRQRFRAVEALAKVGERGGTELATPLRTAIGLLGGGTADRERVIVLVTDGQVGNEVQILAEIAPALRNIKMFTLGIDRAVNAAFLRQLASAGGGLCELVESEDRLDEVMTKVHRRIGTPIATELAVRAEGIEIEAGTVAPTKLPDVYAGAPVVIFGRYRGAVAAGAMFQVTGSSLGDPLRLAIPVAAPRTASWLAASWARAHLRELEDRYAVTPAPATEQEIVRISKKFGVLSRFTAFLAVDRSQIANRGGVIQQVVQPVEEPEGWDLRGGGGQLLSAAPRGGMTMSAPAPASARPSYGAAPMARTIVASAGSRSMPPTSPPPPGQRRFDDPAPGSVPMDVEAERAPATTAHVASVRTAGPPSPPVAASYGEPFALAQGAPPARAEGGVATAYLAQLAKLSVELTRDATRDDAMAVRLLRQRLAQWIEDARAAGLADLAAAVEALVQRLSAALGAPATLGAEGVEVAKELALLAAGSPPPAAPKKSRLAFWK
jgi:Ca-activated chloride channel family protein